MRQSLRCRFIISVLQLPAGPRWLGQKAPVVHGPSHKPLELLALGDDGDAVGADGKSAGAVEFGPTKSLILLYLGLDKI